MGRIAFLLLSVAVMSYFAYDSYSSNTNARDMVLHATIFLSPLLVSMFLANKIEVENLPWIHWLILAGGVHFQHILQGNFLVAIPYLLNIYLVCAICILSISRYQRARDRKAEH